jgi:hypothetical protein
MQQTQPRADPDADRAIIRAQLPVVERWIIEQQGDRLTYIRPQAGAIAYLRYHGTLGSMALAERLRTEQSVPRGSGQVFHRWGSSSGSGSATTRNGSSEGSTECGRVLATI